MNEQIKRKFLVNFVRANIRMLGRGYHPDTEYIDYCRLDDVPVFTDSQAERHERQAIIASQFCLELGCDIYELAFEELDRYLCNKTAAKTMSDSKRDSGVKQYARDANHVFDWLRDHLPNLTVVGSATFECECGDRVVNFYIPKVNTDSVKDVVTVSVCKKCYESHPESRLE